MSEKFINENLPKEKRLGQIGINNQGKKMIIIVYRKANDIDVQFEDGTIVKNKRYSNFIRGKMLYPIKNRIGEVKYNNQGFKMTIINYRDSNDIDIQFEDGVMVYHKYYVSFEKGEIKHPIRYEESFAYYIEVELGLNLDDIWNWEKNNRLGINPYEITKQSNKKVWLYCQENDYHNYDREDNKVGYQITCSHFYNNRRCGYCGNHKVHWKDSLAYNYPQTARMISIEKNNLTFDDCYNITYGSEKRFYFKCDKCKKISNKKIRLVDIIKRSYSCEFCSDGIPITEKFISNIFNQLNEEYIYQLSKSDFKWCGYFRYDFYLPKYNIIIEVNGEQHYKDGWDSLEKTKMNDLFKYKCAKNHVDNYIVIDFRYSTLEWMKENIIKQLNEYFDLSNIDWKLAWEESQNSLCVKTWELHKEGLSNKEISKKLKVSNSTICRWIKNMKF